MTGDLKKFIKILSSKRKIIILLHNNPDPDSIASALGIKYIINNICSSKVLIAYGGIIGRAENQEMVRCLRVKLKHVNDIEIKRSSNVILVDTQPGTGNNSLPKGVVPIIVIDHHPLKRAAKAALYYDVRSDYGSASTIVFEYLKALKINVTRSLATAIFYGIKTDTDDIGRSRNARDDLAMNALYPLILPGMLLKMQHPRIPLEYYMQFSHAMKNTCIYKDVIISDLEDRCTPDMIA